MNWIFNKLIGNNSEHEKIPDLSVKVYEYSLFIDECKNGNLESLKTLNVKNYYDLKNGLKTSCQYNNLDVGFYLLENKSIKTTHQKNVLFKIICEYGNIELLEKFQLEFPDFDFGIEQDVGFRHACANGHYRFILYLFIQRPDIRIEILDEYAFRYACANGHLDVVKLLVNRRNAINSPINQGICNEWALRKSIKNGHIDVAKYLVKSRKHDTFSIVLSSDDFPEKWELLRPCFAMIKIKYWMIGCLYNPNTYWGRRYTNRILLQDYEFC